MYDSRISSETPALTFSVNGETVWPDEVGSNYLLTLVARVVASGDVRRSTAVREIKVPGDRDIHTRGALRVVKCWFIPIEKVATSVCKKTDWNFWVSPRTSV